MELTNSEISPPDLVELNNPAHALLIARTLRKHYMHGVDYCVSRSSGGRLLGGVLYTNYNRHSVALHLCGLVPNWMSRALVFWAFEYPFGMLKVHRLMAVMSSANRSYALAVRMGFTEDAWLPDVVPDGVLVVMSMKAGACRWLGERPRNRAIIIHPEATDVVRQ